MSSASNTKNVFVSNLLQLQNFIKRDPTSYKDEVKLKLFFKHHLLKTFEIFNLSFYKHTAIMNRCFKST